jgi:hypothetical protein
LAVILLTLMVVGEWTVNRSGTIVVEHSRMLRNRDLAWGSMPA